MFGEIGGNRYYRVRIYRLAKKGYKTKALTPSATPCFSLDFYNYLGALRMNPRMKTLSFAVLQVFGVGVAMTVLSAPASAKQTAQTRERIEVTGSNIKRVEGETALPVTVISKEEIQNTGVQ